MAIMNKMREKMTVIFAGLAGAFLLMIIFEWGAQGDFFKGNSRKADEIGKVNGMSITKKDYDDMLQEMRQQKLQEAKKTKASLGEVSLCMWLTSQNAVSLIARAKPSLLVIPLNCSRKASLCIILFYSSCEMFV